MSARAAINKEIFIPHNERMLAAVQVKRRTKKKIPFLATGGQGDYMTFICLSGKCLISVLFIFFKPGLQATKTLQDVTKLKFCLIADCYIMAQ